MKLADEWDVCHGLKSRYVNPMTGDYAMPTMATHMQLLPKGFESEAYRSTDATVFSVAEAVAAPRSVIQSLIGSAEIRLWYPVGCKCGHYPSEDSFLFSFSNRPVQEKLGLWRELRGEG